MTVRQVIPEVLPEAVAASVLRLAQAMWTARADDGQSPAQGEEQVAVLSRQVGQEVLSAGFSAHYGHQQGPRRRCSCGAAQRFAGYRARAIVTVLGAVRYRCAYYRGRDCGAGHYVGEDVLGRHGGVINLPAQEAISLACTEGPSERARVLQQQQDCEQLLAGTLEPMPEQRKDRLYVTLDATNTRFCDDWH